MKPTYSINYIPRIDFKTAYQFRLVSGLFWSLSVLQGGQVEILFSSAMSWIKDGTIAIILVHSRSSTPNLLHKCYNSGTRNALSNFIFDTNEVKVSAHYSSSCNSNSHSTITWTLWWFICAVFRLQAALWHGGLLLRKSPVSATAAFTPNTYTPWSDAKVPESSSHAHCFKRIMLPLVNSISVFAFEHFYFKLSADYCSQAQCHRTLWDSLKLRHCKQCKYPWSLANIEVKSKKKKKKVISDFHKMEKS